MNLNKRGEADTIIPVEANLDDDETCCPVWGVNQVHKPLPELAQPEDFDNDDD